MDNPTEAIYNQNASSWSRSVPNSLSDFTARPYIFKECGDLNNLNVLDIGCGEGYCSRILKKKNNALSVTGIDLSEEMINIANEQEQSNPLGNSYAVGNATSLPFDSDTFDLVLGVFVYNYLSINNMLLSMKEVFRVLKANSRFIFAVPHPSFPHIHKTLAPPFYFDFGSDGYFSSRDMRKFGAINRLDGVELPVQMVHKLMEDYFSSLSRAGFTKMPSIKELTVIDEHIACNKDFFSPLNDIPLHVSFTVSK